MRTVATSSSVSDLRRLIVVVRPVMNVVMPSTDHSVTDDATVMTTVMILCATSGAPTTRSLCRPLVAAVRIVKQRVLVRLRIRVEIAVDLGL